MRKLIALLVITGILAFAATGCSYLKKAKDIKDNLDDIGDIIDDLGDLDDIIDDIDDDGDQNVFSGTVYYPENSAELLRKFSEFGYEFTKQSEDGGTQFMSVHFVYEGSEDVDGVAADIFTVTMVEDDETVVERQWYDEDGRLVKAVKDGEEVDEWYAMPVGMYLGIYTGKVKLTTLVIDENGELETFSYSLEDKRSESSDVGKMEVYEIKSKLLQVAYIYGLVEGKGEKHFALIRSEVPGTEVFEQVVVTHMEFR